MKKHWKKVVAFLTTVIMLAVMAPFPLLASAKEIKTEIASAKEIEPGVVQASPLSVEITTVKPKYTLLSVIEFKVRITNNSDTDIENIDVVAQLGQDLVFVKGSETTTSKNSLAPGEVYEWRYKTKVSRDRLKKADKLLVPLAFMRDVFVGNYSDSDENLSYGSQVCENSARANLISAYANTYSSDSMVQVWYEKQDSIPDIEDPITRSEWILKLADTLGWTEQIKAMNHTNCEFTDIAGKECEKAVQYASVMNVFDETTGKFLPDEPVTREFAAVTATRAMGFLNTKPIESADKDTIKHPYEVYSAVTAGIFELSDNNFYPTKELTESEFIKVISKISEIEKTGENTEEHSEIVYTDDFVSLSNDVQYTPIDSKKFYIEISEETKKLQTGKIIFLNEEYYKISDIREENSKFVVTTTDPLMHEVFQSINVGGSQTLTAEGFIPAEGIEVIPQQAQARSVIDIATLSLKVDQEIQENVKLSGEVTLKNPKIDVKIDIDWSKISWTNWLPDIKDVHAILTFDAELGLEIEDSRDDKAPINDGVITLGRFPVLGAMGVGVYVDVAIAYTIEGQMEIVFTTSGKAGFQIYNNMPKEVATVEDPDFDTAELEASAKIGPKISGLLEITKKWKLIDFSIYFGPAVNGNATIRDTGLFCLDATTYVFAQFSAMQESVIGDWLDIQYSYDILNEDNSFFKQNLHFENMKPVPECTYKSDKIEFNGHYYQVYDTPMTWDEAKAYCESLGGHLVTITSGAEQEFVESLIANGKMKSYWLGGTDIANEGAWEWITGEKFDYTNWREFMPDNWQNEDYLMMYKEMDPSYTGKTFGRWNDLKSDGTCPGNSYFSKDIFGLVCEWDTDVKPTGTCITKMEIVDHGQYTGNLGDSRVFHLDKSGLPGNDNRYYGNGNIGLDGTEYNDGLEVWIARWNFEEEISWAYATYKLDNKYTNLTGKTSLIKGSANTDNFDTTIYFYNGDTLLQSYNLTNSDYEKQIEVDVTGVNELKILVKDNKAVKRGTSFALYDMFLK